MLEPNAFAGDGSFGGGRVVAGRFARADKPSEFTVNRQLFAKLHAKIGDRFAIAAYSVAQVQANAGDSEPEVPRFDVTLVGVTESPADFDLPVPQLVFPATFLDAHPDIGWIETGIDVRLAPGVARAAVEEQFKALTEPVGASIATSKIVSPDARRAVRFFTTALAVISLVAAVSAAFLVLQVSTRLLELYASDRSSLSALGLARRDLAAERLVEGASAAVLSAFVATIVAVSLSTVFPFGALRTLEPVRGVRFDATVVGLGSATLLVLFAVSALAAVRGYRKVPLAGVSVAQTAVTRSAGVERTAAARMTFYSGAGRRAASRFLIPGAFCVAGVTASAIVAFSIIRTVDHPVRWGADYDELFGDPYSPAQGDLAAAVKNDPDLTALALATTGPLTINGHTVTVFATEAIRGTTAPVMVEGQRPRTANEIALGAESARRLLVQTGDTVNASGSAKHAVELRVTGLVATPDTAGNGASMTFEAYRAIEPAATKNLLLVKYRKGASLKTSERIAKTIFTPVGALPTPTSVGALEKVIPAPKLLAALLTVLVIVAAALQIMSSVRRHRRDLSVLVALGSTPRQIRSIVYLHAVLVSGLCTAVGLPVGLLLGRRIVGAVFDSLGVVRGAFVPFPFVVGTVCVTVGGAVLLASAPARSAWSMKALLTSDERT